MTSTLDQAYLAWLEPQLRGRDSNPNRTYWDLMREMLFKEFVHVVAHDDSRVQDGLDLRAEFQHDNPQYSRADLHELGACSFLEVLIGLSRRLAFMGGGDAPTWAWQLMHNLGIHRMADPLSVRNTSKLDGIMESVIFRAYHPSGDGGFFPLSTPHEDQTKVELWYQMAAYLDDLHHSR